jgi:hypothetical protein
VKLSSSIKILVFCTFLLIFSSPIFAQNTEKQELFFIAPLFETIGYSDESTAFGGGLTIGTGSGIAFGMRLLYALNPEDFTFVEILFFLRYYFFGSGANTGPFVQLNTGPVLYIDNITNLKGYGNISAGLTAGWRFSLGNRFFLEPAARFGFPYLAGAGVSAGFRY